MVEKYINMLTDCKLSKSVKLNYLNNPDWQKVSDIFEFRIRKLDGSVMQLDVYKDCVCIFVNTGSQCFTAPTQFEQLVQLYKKYKKTKGLRILAFPCNQFSNNEPGDAEEVAVIYKKFGVKFDVTEKVNVNCDDADFVWKFMKSAKTIPGTDPNSHRNLIKSNFEKFIINRKGEPVARFPMRVMPNDLLPKLEEIWNLEEIQDSIG